MISFSALGKIGNLGNQLFQIASITGIALANKTKAAFPEWKYEKYFESPLPHGKQAAELLKEKHFHFDESLFHIGGQDYDLSGYYQSSKYWQHSEEGIKKQFSFKAEFKQQVKEKFADAFNKPVVAISIRRGDFVDNPVYYQVPISYYLSAFYKYFPDHNILIFSDDFKYCRQHFEPVNNVFYSEGLSDIEQLCLMSQCDDFIISNSTFSWWGAYLSGSKNVIRPVKNFDNYDADEKDFWPPEWIVHNEKINLTNTTFVIPVFYDHIDRRHNIMMTVGFLKKHFDTNIIIGEQGGNKFEFMQKYCKYVQFDLPHFHRTKMINQMCLMADTPIVVNWDGDNICVPALLSEAVKAIEDGADIAYPFDGRVIRVPRYMFMDVAKKLDVYDIDLKKCNQKAWTSVGHAVVMNRQSFINCGMENENFISWGPEDSERYDRYHILGLKVKRMNGPMFHADHFVGANSSSKHPHFAENNKEFYKIKSMKKEALSAYVNTWEWCK